MRNKQKTENLKKVHLNLNPYYKDLVDHPEKIHPRLEGEAIVNIMKLGLDALIIQESNRLEREDQDEQGETE